MYFWNINKIIIAIKEDSFSKKQKNIYKILFGIIILFLVLPNLFFLSSLNMYDLWDWVSFIALTILGFVIMTKIYNHEKYKIDENKIGLINTYFILYLPIFLRTILLQIVLTIAACIAIPHYLESNQTNIIDLTLSKIADITCTFMLVYYFKKVFK